MTRSHRWGLALLAALAGVACGGDGARHGVSVERDTLANGAARLRYAGLPVEPERLATVDLRLGALEGDRPDVFGDVRGIEADGEGNVYVLDAQAGEVRVFGPEGRYLRTIAKRGEGPGELDAANGMVLVGDSLLWIQDHGRWRMSTVRSFLVSWDPASETRDSVFLGVVTSRFHVATNGRGGYSYQGVPHDPTPLTVVDPRGGFWTAGGAGYRIARLDEGGDTTLVVEADVPATPVTEADRDAYVARLVERDSSAVRAAREVARAMPSVKPLVTGLTLDDEGRLWVRRGGAEGAPPRYDVFSRDGDFEGSLALDFVPSPYLPLKIRGGSIYALVPDELDVAYVVRAAVPR